MSEQHIQINRIYSVNPCFIEEITVVGLPQPKPGQVEEWRKQGWKIASPDEKHCWLDLKMMPHGFTIQTELQTDRDNNDMCSRLVDAAECPKGWESVYKAPVVKRWPDETVTPKVV